MKRLIQIASMIILCVFVFCSCSSNEEDYSENISSNFNSSVKDENNDEQNSTCSENDNGTLDSSTIDKNDELQSENDVAKNEIVLTVDDDAENTYYPTLKNAVFNSDCVEFYNMKGCYFQIISSYEEFNKIIVSPSNIDPAVFEKNYILCISRSAGIGYYDFKCEDEKYSISSDCYSSYGHGIKNETDAVITSQSIDFVVVPKTEVEYVDGYQEITVNKVEKNRKPLGFVGHDGTATLPEKLQAWKTNASLIKEYGLTFDGIKGDYESSILVFSPEEPTCDFLVTKSRIENGNLYLECEKYTSKQNSYLNNHDVKFYLLNDIDIDTLSENFNVYVTVREVSAPLAPIIEISINVDLADAILIAQNHFFNTFAKELPDGYIYTAKHAKESEKYWNISIFDKGINESYTESIDDNYVYVIDKTNGEIVRIEIVDDTPISEAEAKDIVENYLRELYPELVEDSSATVIQYVEENKYLVIVKFPTRKVGCLIDKYTMELEEIFMPD